MKKAIIAVIYAIALIALLGLFGCSDNDDDKDAAADENQPGCFVRCSKSGEPGEVPVLFEYIVMDAEPSPPNPYSRVQTPEDQCKIGIFRVRQDMGDAPPRPVSAVLVMSPGHTISGNEFFHMACEIIRQTDGDMEVWLQERRSHFLEDNYGMELAEQRGDPQLAWDYYFNNKELEGQSFAGYLDAKNRDTDFMSEWSLGLEFADLHQIISLIDEAHQSTNVFLGGHSRGVAFSQGYAAYRFPDGHYGYEDLAGLILIDGAVREGGPESDLQYRWELEKLRRGWIDRYVATPSGKYGGYVYALLEILAMTAADGLGDPNDHAIGADGFWPHDHLFKKLVRLFNYGTKFEITNEALFGVLIDDQFGAIELLTARMGTATGGEVKNILGRDVLTEKYAVYSWLSGHEVEPTEDSDLQTLIWQIFEGPSNIFDWYYAERWDLELFVAGYHDFETGGTWRDKYYQMRTSLVDIPVYALATGLLIDLGEYDDYREALAPLKGQSLPRSEAGFRLLEIPEWAHIDPVTARRESNPFFPDLIDWVYQNAVGQVQAPEFGSD